MTDTTEPKFPIDPEATARLSAALENMVASAQEAAKRAGENLARVAEIMNRRRG